jgi:hypothetical protein
MAQAQVPLFFDGQDFRVCSALNYVAAAVLDPLVVLTDGSKAFTAPVTGVDPTLPQHLATMAWVQQAYGVTPVWLQPVLGIGTLAPPSSPTTGDRWIVPVGATDDWATHDNQVATWTGTAWTFATAPNGATTTSLDGVQRSFIAGTWRTSSQGTDHSQLQGLQGGATSELFHLTLAEHSALTGNKTARFVLAAPTGADGPMVARALSTDDILSGTIATAQGGLGIDSSASNGFPVWLAGAVAFRTQLAWTDLDPAGIPTSFPADLHAASHQPGGGDQLVLDMSQIQTGFLSLARGGTGEDLRIVAQRTVWAGPKDSQGAPTFRTLDPNDITGATAALQVIRRDALNQANEWATLDAATFGAVSQTRLVTAGAFLTGGGPLSADVMLSWQGLAVLFGGIEVSRQRQLEFVGAGVTVEDNAIGQKTVVTITQGGGGGGGVADASTSYARTFLFGGG